MKIPGYSRKRVQEPCSGIIHTLVMRQISKNELCTRRDPLHAWKHVRRLAFLSARSAIIDLVSKGGRIRRPEILPIWGRGMAREELQENGMMPHLHGA